VEPLARQLGESRRETVQVAQQVPTERWANASPLEGWTFKDLLAHVAGDTGKGSLKIMEAARNGETPECTFLDGGDAWNARDIAARRDRSIAELVDEVTSDGERWQQLISQLTDNAVELCWPDFPMGLREYFEVLVSHEQEHLAQLRTALEAAG
jgi:uncharacterized protein (TIGR03083 family)